MFGHHIYSLALVETLLIEQAENHTCDTGIKPKSTCSRRKEAIARETRRAPDRGAAANWDAFMLTTKKKNAPALKHGGYSAVALLPGEDPAGFKELHDALIAEFSPSGALEEDIVADIAHLVRRKRHLGYMVKSEDCWIFSRGPLPLRVVF